jgi:hypothetical protein
VAAWSLKVLTLPAKAVAVGRGPQSVFWLLHLVLHAAEMHALLEAVRERITGT